MSTITFVAKLKKPTRKKHKQWLAQQKEYAACVNHCVARLQKKEKLSSKNVDVPLKSAIKNEAIRRAKKALSDYKKGVAKKMPVFKRTLPISINNQNWDTKLKNGHWTIGFTTNEGKKYVPVIECKNVQTYFPFLTKENREFRGTLQLLRKGRDWYVAIPMEVSCKVEVAFPETTPIGVDLGLRHLAVVCEPKSGKRQLFSGKEVGYKRRHFRSLRRSLGKKKAQRAIERIGQKESRWMMDYNRKLAKEIVSFASQFPHPVIKLEQLDDIRKTCTSTKRADRTIHSWTFYELKRFIKERAAKVAIPVVDIDSSYTSQRCYTCKHINKKNRNNDKFRCVHCGHKDHADINASKNIATSTSLAV